VLTIGDPERFESSRDVAAYLGLVPKRDQSGAGGDLKAG
jgi:transposase